MGRYEEVSLDERDGWQVLALAGDVDVASAPRLRDRLVQLITNGPPRVVVDMSGLTFIDSMGLGALISGLKRARAHGGDLRLVGPSDHVAEVLAITRLDAAFLVTDTVDDALAATPG